MESFLATVTKVFLKSEDFLELKTDADFVTFYNENKKFDKKDARFLGAIEFQRATPILKENYAFPFDKNNFTFPIKGETVVILKLHGLTFWLPYSKTPYSNYRRDYITYAATLPEDNIIEAGDDMTGLAYRKNTAAPKTTATKPRIITWAFALCYTW